MEINQTDHLLASAHISGEGTHRSDISIVLVCWNNKDYLEPCLESLYDSKLDSTFDVVVVDNGSNDGSIEMLHDNYPEIMVIENGQNVGLSKASNQGIQATGGRYVLLLNNDTIVNKNALDSMVSYLDSNPDVGAVGGQLLNGDGSFQAGYAKFSTLWEELLIATGIGFFLVPGYPSHHKANQPTSVGWLSSACLLVRRDALDQVGLLDEVYFIYGDEADLQYRLQKSGWKVIYLPDAITIHFGGGSMNRWKRRKMVYRGKMLFYQKNYPHWHLFVLRLMFAGISALKAVLWGIGYLFPKSRERAKKELRSNWDVIKLTMKLV